MPPAGRNIPRPNFSTTSKKITSSTSPSLTPVKMFFIKSAVEWSASTEFSARPTRLNFFGLPALYHGRAMEPLRLRPSAAPTICSRLQSLEIAFPAAIRSIIGQTFILNGTALHAHPASCHGGELIGCSGDVFLPVKPTRSEQAYVAGEFPPVWYLMGHLKPGVSVAFGQPTSL